MIHYLTSGYEDLVPSCPQGAIVSVVMGPAHETTWERLCSRSWVAYADRLGLDIVILKERIDRSDTSRSPGWQKFLALNLPFAKRYARIVWLDSDIIICDDAPDILEYAGPPEKVSLCVDAGRLSPASGQTYLECLTGATLRPEDFATDWRRSRHGLYLKENLPPHDVVFNPGVMVLSPVHHNDVLTSLYPRPELSHETAKLQLSHRLIETGLAHPISPRFNWGVLETYHLVVKLGLNGDEAPEFVARILHFMVCAEMRNAYFTHFYGMMNLLRHYADNPAFAAPLQAAA